METSRNTKKLVLVAVCLALLLMGFIGYISWHGTNLSAQLVLQVAPSDASIQLPDRPLHVGNIRLKPGAYQVTFSRPGFATVSKAVILRAHQVQHVGAALTSNSPSTADWYSTHPLDALLAEQITGRSFDSIGKTLDSTLSLVKLLPYGQREFSIDYGSSRQSPQNPNAVALYVTYHTEEGKQAALDWISSQGYDPAKLEIIYTADLYNL